MRRRLRIALLMESSRAYSRNLMRGIADYARAYGPWTIFHEERSLENPYPADLKAWRPDGIIARIPNAAAARQLRRLKVPGVDMVHEEGLPGFSEVIVDQEAIARLAADHLLDRGLKHFAYCGLKGVTFSEMRGRFFTEHLRSHGHEVIVFQTSAQAPIGSLAKIEAKARRQGEVFVAWLRSLPKPVGLLACHDMRGYQILSLCGEYGINVPDEVAVIGVDNDVVQCELCDPPLTSVDTGGQRIGYEAAALLHRMIETGRPGPAITRIAPLGVVARGSTAVFAVADPEMTAMLREIREHACERLTIEQLTEKYAVSRSTLDRWFAKHLGRSPKEEIQRVRVERVQELLLGTDLSIAEIGELAGFDHLETMYRLVKRATGHTPLEYRSRRTATNRHLF